MQEEAMDDYDPDPVIRELDVFVSKGLQDELFVLQYPMRPLDRPLPDPISAKIKPLNRLLEIKHEIKQAGKNFDPAAPEHLLLEELTHAAAAVPAATNYAIGVVRDNELHLTPLSGILQMRPAFRHVDIQAAIEEPDDDDRAAAEKPVAGEPRQVMFKRKETERATQARQRSYAYKRDREDAERWVDLAVHDAASAHARDEFENMFCGDRARPICFLPGPAAYLRRLDHLHPGADAAALPAGTGDSAAPLDLAAADGGAAPAAAAAALNGGGTGASYGVGHAAPLPVDQLSALKGVGALRAYVRAAVVITHDMLKEVAEVASDAAVARELSGFAVPVRGAWVLRSERLLPATAAGGGGGAATAAARARDAALALLHAHGGVSRAALQRRFEIVPGATLKTVLEGVAALDRGLQCWELKVEDTFDLALALPGVAAAADAEWRAALAALAAEWGGAEAVQACAVTVRPPYAQRCAAHLSGRFYHGGGGENGAGGGGGGDHGGSRGGFGDTDSAAFGLGFGPASPGDGSAGARGRRGGGGGSASGSAASAGGAREVAAGHDAAAADATHQSASRQADSMMVDDESAAAAEAAAAEAAAAAAAAAASGGGAARPAGSQRPRPKPRPKKKS
ncbi:Sin-like protein conserved region-domain-containing protein [Tribonema minus]|uniref:Sin-like protein conserved region-domain-containing protein n=1 Tax=Tribonema minus TaxID=303371 RepID=A0A836CI66_9STRA|nr:Sin-like protein conserved region-domain-containing protein [Tribonema minus]